MAARRGRRRRKPRRVPGPGLVTLGVALTVGAWLLGGMEREVVESGYRRIEAGRVRLDAGVSWVDERWEAELAARLGRYGELDANDAAARAALVEEVGALSFVAEVGEPEVVWPDGLRLAVRFRTPVACVSVGSDYLVVADDAVVLSGTWPDPPPLGAGWLPVIGPIDGALDVLLPGDVLVREDLLDALSIAVSMATHLGPDDRARLGRVRIDATRARETSVDEPGALLLLEGGREVGFGRAPRMEEPGSVPPAHKWEGLSRALALGADDAWAWLDLRWDRPELLPRRPEAESVEDDLPGEVAAPGPR